MCSRTLYLFILAAMAIQLPAQLTIEQRVHDFQSLAASLSKRYAPAEWKRQLYGVDILNTAPWLERVRSASDDVEFHEICAEYVAGLNDYHIFYTNQSTFRAYLGFSVDVYDGAFLVDSVDRPSLSVRVGDELLSIDGKSVDQWIVEFSRIVQSGNDVTTKRMAARLLTFRSQNSLPRAGSLPDNAVVSVKRQHGDVDTFLVAWQKGGLPFEGYGPIRGSKPSGQHSVASSAAHEGMPDYLTHLQALQNWRLPPAKSEILDRPAVYGEDVLYDFVAGVNARSPAFELPESFERRLGQSAGEFHFSGIYEFEGLKIGYLRIPSFAPPAIASAVRELEKEVEYLNGVTDGLVVDVMRNSGGNCYLMEAARRLIATPFYGFGDEVRPSWEYVSLLDSYLESAKRDNAPQWVLDAYSGMLDESMKAYWSGNKELTAPIPSCPGPGASGFEQTSASAAYSKPIVVLIDEFSGSATEIFASILQDNRRALLVGARTAGGGGSVGSIATGAYAEASVSLTKSLVVRQTEISVPGYPSTRYIENIGVHPDVHLPYMTRDNLNAKGRPFVNALTGIVAEHIRSEGR